MAMQVTSSKTDSIIAFVAAGANLVIALIGPYGRDTFFVGLAIIAFVIGQRARKQHQLETMRVVSHEK